MGQLLETLNDPAVLRPQTQCWLSIPPDIDSRAARLSLSTRLVGHIGCERSVQALATFAATRTSVPSNRLNEKPLKSSV